MHIPSGAKPNKVGTFTVFPQSDIITTPCDFCLDGEAIFHQRPTHFEVHIPTRQILTAQQQKQLHSQIIIQLFMYKQIAENIPLKRSRRPCGMAIIAFALWKTCIDGFN